MAELQKIFQNILSAIVIAVNISGGFAYTTRDYNWWGFTTYPWYRTSPYNPWPGYSKLTVTSLRLYGGSHNEGFVQVFANGEWLNVCGQYFRQTEADVVCRSKGYPTGHTTYWSEYHYIPYGGKSSLVTCHGGESKIQYCITSYMVAPDNACRSYSAWVKCENKIRLVDGLDAYSGRVEVYYQGRWGTVCDDLFDRSDALVICKMLNITTSYSEVAAYQSARFGQGSGAIIVDDLQCNGTEGDIAECSSQPWLTNNCGHGEDAGVDCQYLLGYTTDTYEATTNAYVLGVRVSSGHYGFVEVNVNGRWGYICDDSFTHSDAISVCRSMGYQGIIYDYTSQSGGTVVITNLDCNGIQDNLNQCSYIVTDYSYRYCDRAYVECRASTEYTTEGYGTSTSTYGLQVRLSYGRDGIVMVKAQGSWGNLCDDYFTEEDAEVVCKTMGYPRSMSHYRRSGSGYSTINNLRCNGGEENINQCSFAENYGYRTCNTAYVTCENRIRLINGPDLYSGTVEVFYMGRWGTVCDDSFDHADAIVICRMLGMYNSYSSVRAYSNAHFGSGSGNITIDELNCSGNENDITNCSSNPWLIHDCSHTEDAGVDCLMQMHTTEISVPESTYYGTPVRLINGYNSASGRFEILYNGAWRSVCSQGFGHNEAKVICRQLGIYYGDSYGRVYSYWSPFGSGQGSSLDRLSCSGYESDVTGCFTDYWRVGHCSHNYDVGIECNDLWIDQTTEIPYITTERTTMYTLSQTMHVSCNENGWHIDVDMYTLRQIYPSAVASDIYLGENSCTGTEYYGSLRFRQGFGQCLTNEIVKNDVLVYSNALIYAQHDRNHPFIIKSFNWTIPVECDVEKNATSNGHLHHIEHAITAEPPVVGYSKYAVNMTFYQDPNFAYEIMGNPLQVIVGSKVYVKVFTPAADWNIKMRVHTCYAKPTADASEHLKYFIIKNGCEVDANTHIVLQYAHETRFVFQDFEYTNNHEGIFLYCDANFCDSNDYSSECSQTCHNIVRRGSGVQTP